MASLEVGVRPRAVGDYTERSASTRRSLGVEDPACLPIRAPSLFCLCTVWGALIVELDSCMRHTLQDLVSDGRNVQANDNGA